MRILEINFWPVIDSAGGAERVFCNMANELTLRGHDVIAVCFDDKKGYPLYPLSKDVHFYNIQNMGKTIKATQWRKILRELYRIFGKNGFNDPYNQYIYSEVANRLLAIMKNEKPDIVVCYDIKSLQLLEKMNLDNIKVVFMSHMDSESFWQKIRPDQIIALQRADCIQVLLMRDKEFLEKHLNRNVVVIPNSIIQITQDEGDVCKREKIIINVARIDKNKNQILLIEAFARIAHKYSEWRVQIYGSDFSVKYRKELDKKIQNLNLTSQVKLMGITDDILPVLNNAAIFAFPSVNEGFGLALAEAMSIGLPCIGLKTCAATRNLIVDGETGILTGNNIKEFSEKLEQLIEDESLRNRLATETKKAIEAYSPEKVWNQWEKLLYKLVNQ